MECVPQDLNLRPLLLQPADGRGFEYRFAQSIFNAFDDLLLLAEGKVMYCGRASDAASHFGSLGHKLPKLPPPDAFRTAVCYTKEMSHALSRLAPSLRNHAGLQTIGLTHCS